MVKKMIEKPFMTPHAVMRHLLGKKKIMMDLACKLNFHNASTLLSKYMIIARRPASKYSFFYKTIKMNYLC
jgi:hypothetical protein